MRMRSIYGGLCLAAVLGLLLAFTQQAAGQTALLKVGDKAPDFSLPDQNMKQVKLSDFRGKQNVVMAFYVLAFTGG